jgi:hypothetical protein
MCALTVALCLAPTASAAQIDVSSTQAFIADYDTMIQARSVALAGGVSAVNRYVNSLDQSCPGVLSTAPMTGSGAQALGGEVSGAVGLALIQTSRGAMQAFVTAVGRLLWSNPSVAHAVGKFAGAVLGYLRLSMPNVCGDLRTWAASGYKTVPATTTSFNFDVHAAASQQSTAIPSGALAPFETGADASVARAALQVANGFQKSVSADVVPPLNRLFLVLGVH